MEDTSGEAPESARSLNITQSRRQRYYESSDSSKGIHKYRDQALPEDEHSLVLRGAGPSHRGRQVSFGLREAASHTVAFVPASVGVVVNPGQKANVYTQMSGLYGNNPRPLVKRATKGEVYKGHRTEDLVQNDLAMMERLSWARHVARVYHGEVKVNNKYMFLVVEKYHMSLNTFLAIKPKDMHIDTFTIGCQFMDFLQTMEAENIVHGDLRLENFYFHKLRGESQITFI